MNFGGEQFQIDVQQEMCSVMESAFIRKQNKVINTMRCYCIVEYIVLNLIQLLSACLQSRCVDQMQYFMLSSELSSVSLF